MRSALKKFIFRLLGKDPEAIVVTFGSGDPGVVAGMFAEIQRLVPDRRHFLVKAEEVSGQSAFQIYGQLRRRFGAYRIGQAPLLFDGDVRYRAFRLAAFLCTPTKILAYNARLERHQLSFGTAIASFLFLKGVPLDRIFLRPRWLVPWKEIVRSILPTSRNSQAALFPLAVAVWPFSLPISRFLWRTAAQCGSSTCCARWPPSSTFSCLLSAIAKRAPIKSPCSICARA